MKRVIGLLFVGVLLTGMTVQGVERVKIPKPEKFKVKDVFSAESLKKVDAFLEKAVQDEAVPSVVCYIEYKGEPVYYKAFGNADQEKGKLLKKNAIFRIASQTKLITTVALMTLYEEGLFSLDDPIKKYLPDFSHPVVYVSGSYEAGNLVTRPAVGDITIRQLLSHSSGISYNPYDQDVRIICYDDNDSTVSTEAVVQRIAKLPLSHDPGKGFTYGFSLDVAGRLAEVISGQRLDDLIRERVLKPLDMSDSYFYLPKNKSTRLVPLYQKPTQEDPIVLAEDSLERAYPLYTKRSYYSGGAGMSGTIEDYAHLCQMIVNKGNYNSKRILSRKTVEQMCSDQLGGVAGGYKFGLGLEITNKETAAKTMKTKGALRWGGYYGTEYLIDPTENLIVLFYTNKVSWYPNEVYDQFLNLVYMSLY